MTKKSQSSILAEFRLSILVGLAILALTFFACSSDSNDPVPTTRILPDEITFSDIKYWVGSGPDSAMFIVQWNDSLTDDGFPAPDGLVWGYRFNCNNDNQNKGIDMIEAIAAADSQFYALLYRTGVDTLGTAVGGLGYDLNNNLSGFKLILLPDPVNNVSATLSSPNGLFFADTINGVDSVYRTFDYYRSKDSLDHWQSGWYQNGYWSYWVDDTTTGSSKWVAYSGSGPSTRKLKNKSIDAWFFDVDFNTYGCMFEDGCDGRTIFGDLNSAPVIWP